MSHNWPSKQLAKGRKHPKTANQVPVILGFALLAISWVCASHKQISSAQPVSLLGTSNSVHWLMVDLHLLWFLCVLVISLPWQRCIFPKSCSPSLFNTALPITSPAKGGIDLCATQDGLGENSWVCSGYLYVACTAWCFNHSLVLLLHICTFENSKIFLLNCLP